MKRVILIIAILSIQFSLNAQVTIHVQPGQDVEIVLRDSLPNYAHLYGDVVKTSDGKSENYGGESERNFNKAWNVTLTDGIKFVRDSEKGVILQISGNLAEGEYPLVAILAVDKSSENKGWCAGEKMQFVVSVRKIVEQSTVNEQRSDKPAKENDDSDEPKEQHFWRNVEYLPVLWLLVAICLVVIVALSCAYIQLRQKLSDIDKKSSETNRTLKEKQVVNQPVQKTNQANTLTKEDVEILIDKAMKKSMVSPTPAPTPTPRPTPTPHPTPTPSPKPKEESFDTLEYDFDKNIFIRTGKPQGVFVITKKNERITFTFKNSDVCLELLPNMQMYIGCVRIEGNTSNVSGIASINEGVLMSVDNNTFTVKQQIVVNLR